MASINNATREIVCKVVYYGPGMSGKTTNLQIIHRGLPQDNRGQLVSLDTHQERTLFFDFLPIDLGAIEGYQTKFQLYTVPGQTYYNATRKLVLRGVDGIVFVADSQMGKMDENLESWNNLLENLAEYGYRIEEIPVVLQYNKQDVMGALSVKDMDAALNREGKHPSMGAVAFEGKGVKDTLKIVASGVLDRLRHQLAAVRSGAGRTIAQAAAASSATAVAEAPPTPKLRARSAREAASASPVPEKKRRLIDPALLNRVRPMLTRRAAPPPPPRWDFTQDCDVCWRGLRIGRAAVRVEPRQNLDHEGAYLVEASMRMWGLFRRSISGPAEPANEQRAGHGARLPLAGSNGHGPEALIEPGPTPRLWMRMGSLRLVPPGQSPRDWPDDERLMPPAADNSTPNPDLEEVSHHVAPGA